MDPILTHLRLNHFPIVLSVVGAVAVIVAMITRRRAAWRYAAMTLVFGGLTAYPAVWTGQQAEGETRKHWFIERGAWHEHEEAAEFAMYAMLVAGVVAAYALYRERGYQRSDRMGQPARIAAPIWLQALVTLSALAGGAAMARAGYLGGEITHANKNLMTPPPGWVAPARPNGPPPTATP